jgi:PAS domain S-box-containing protein
VARQLEDELVRAKLQLRHTIEQYEVQQEELRASNEELQAMNEELRSSTEELETSKEELQSVNEELTTVNQELKIKIDELSQAHNDTRNLVNSTDVSTVFVDRSMRVKLFTPRARTLFSLLPGDTGRPLMDITHKLVYPQLAADIERVLDTLAMAEQEVRSTDGHWFIVRVLPYRTAEDHIAGVVLTFTDITARKQAEEKLRESEQRMRLVLESIPEFALMTIDPEGTILTWNRGAQDMFGYTEKEAVGQKTAIVFTEEDRQASVPQKEIEEAREKGRALDERWHVRKDGTRLFVSGVMAPLLRGSTLLGYIKIARDLTERHAAEDALRTAREQLEARVHERTSELAAANETLRREIAERAHSEEIRVRLLRLIVDAQEEERRRISRELHDQLGQELTALGLRVAAVKSSASLDKAARAALEGIEEVVRNIDNDVEFLVWELRPTGLDELGLTDALADYTARWSRYFGVPTHLHTRLESRLAPEIETVLYRVVQEALNNIAKHARAKTVNISVERDGAQALLEVTDDGVGFDPASAREGKGLGLVGMKERAALIGGSADVRSVAGTGTTISVRVPVEPR